VRPPPPHCNAFHTVHRRCAHQCFEPAPVSLEFCALVRILCTLLAPPTLRLEP
jgi:hypothetical protein